ncbi:phosphoribosylglycinamide synthetase C domain-containing protein [Allobaculum stercoricanis]|uniref:phosphoribosylglycinamide synthetase C domain-containing protein n=1 Tax=Allobaculum stercoricanis TaxID=174709 RepID=UPI00248D7588|nr:phosphoribosylglycinamide synthetase C domain-containing protein [Allobaculum stercoricanis]
MKVIIIGENAKEQALAYALEQNGNHQVLVCPGNPFTHEFEQSMEELPEPYHPEKVLETITAVDPDEIILLDEHLIRQGMTQDLARRGWDVIAPNQAAVEVIDDKLQWATLMKERNIPVADFLQKNTRQEAIDFIQEIGLPLVLKEANGLKRFAIPYNEDEAIDDVNEWFDSGCQGIIFSEFLSGVRFNLPVLAWKERVLPLLPFVVTRGVYENEDDPQAKGLGCVCGIHDEIATVYAQQAVQDVLVPFLKALDEQGIEYEGILTGEFIVSQQGPVCVNIKAGLSETGACALFPLMNFDLLKAWKQIKNGEQPAIKWRNRNSVSLVLVGKDYPQEDSKDQPIEVDEDFEGVIYGNHAALKDGQLVSDGGRVLIVSGMGHNLLDAATQALASAKHIHCADLIYRTDIGKEADQKEA